MCIHIHWSRYNHWSIVQQAAATSGLACTGSVIFDRASYPPYINRKAIDSKSFAATDALQYVFARGATGPVGGAEEGVRALVEGLGREQREVLAAALAAGVDVGALAQKALRQVERKQQKKSAAAAASQEDGEEAGSRQIMSFV